MSRHLLTLAAVWLLPATATASVAPLGFNLNQNVWDATHIVLVEGDTVVESWRGDLKPGSKLPAGADRFTRIPMPGFDPDRFGLGEKPPVVIAKRRVLFLAYIPRLRSDSPHPVWSGADYPGDPNNDARPPAVAWIDGERAYTALGSRELGYELHEDGSFAGLKQTIELGNALRALFDAAKAEKDPARRVERVLALAPTVVQFVGRWSRWDIIRAVQSAGRAGAPQLAKWALEERGGYEGAFYALTDLGDDGYEAVDGVLTKEAEFWDKVLLSLGTYGRADRTPRTGPKAWRTPDHLYHVLKAVHGMKLSAENVQKLRHHPGLKKLGRHLRDDERMKPMGSKMVDVHALLLEILDGYLKPRERE